MFSWLSMPQSRVLKMHFLAQHLLQTQSAKKKKKSSRRLANGSCKTNLSVYSALSHRPLIMHKEAELLEAGHPKAPGNSDCLTSCESSSTTRGRQRPAHGQNSWLVGSFLSLVRSFFSQVFFSSPFFTVPLIKKLNCSPIPCSFIYICISICLCSFSWGPIPYSVSSQMTDFTLAWLEKLRA